MVSLDALDGGKFLERFNYAMKQVGNNIMDPNMDPEAKRGISIALELKPTGSGSLAVSYQITPKLAKPAKSKFAMLVGQDPRTGRIEINEYGNNTPSYQVVAQAAAPQPQPSAEPQDFDPETGEILQQPYQKPIDYRATR